MKKSIGAKPLIQPNPVFIVGSYDEKGNPNIMTVAWGGTCCSRPPCAAVSLRKATRSYGNIRSSRAFSINIPSTPFVRDADYIGIYSGKNENKFESLGLTPMRCEKVNAPYVKEFPLIVECKLLRTVKIGLHHLFIGKIRDIKVDDSVLDKDGLPAIEKVRPFVYDHAVPGYYVLGEFLGRAYSIGRKRGRRP